MRTLMDVETVSAHPLDSGDAAAGQPDLSAAPPTLPAVTDCLLNHAILTIEDVFSSSSLSDNHDPFGPTNLAAAAPPQKVMEAQKPIQYRTQTSTQQLQSACISMYSKADGILCFGYLPSANGTRIATLTIKIPSGPSRKYVTDVAYAQKKEAREAVARLALDMGAVDFLQTGDDKKHLDRARANMDGEASDGVVSTLGGKVHHFNVEAVAPSPAIWEIEDCCQTWRTARVSPHWLIFTQLQDPRRYGAMLEIRLTAELANPSIVKVWSTAAEYSLPTKAKNDVAELAIKQGVLDFIKFGNQQTYPNDGPQPTIPPLQAVGETFGSPNHVDPLALPRPSIGIRKWVAAMPQPIPNNIKLEGGTNAIAWVNQVSSQNKVPITYARVYSANGKGVGCILRAAAPDVAERSWFVDAMFNSWQEARLAVCFDAVSRGGYDEFMKSAGSALREINKAQQKQEKQQQQSKRPPLPPPPPAPAPAQNQKASSSAVTFATIKAECSKAGLPSPKLEVDRKPSGATTSATLTINVGKDARLTYTVEGHFPNNVKAEAAVVEKAAKGGLIDFLTTFTSPTAESQKAKSASEEKNNNKTDQASKKKQKKPKKSKAQNNAATGTTAPTASSSGTASNASWPLPKRPNAAEPSSPVVWPRVKDSPGGSGESRSSRGAVPVLSGANMIPLPSRSTHANPTPTLHDNHDPRAPKPTSPPLVHRPPPIRLPGRPEEPLPPPPAYGYSSLPNDAAERYHRYENEFYGGHRPYEGSMMYGNGMIVREPAMPPPPPPPVRRSSPPRWEGYMDYPPTERKGKGKLRARDGFYGEYGPMDAEEGEVREQSARYGPPVDDRGWYGEGHYPSYPNNMPTYDDEEYGGPSKKGRWNTTIPGIPPPPGW
ncbi:hypothetical protein FRC04_000867 [Tulasnella sp. 424]|nr:hypothetical protein FRC04_000867 [Tulasnella sp. 424]